MGLAAVAREAAGWAVAGWAEAGWVAAGWAAAGGRRRRGRAGWRRAVLWDAAPDLDQLGHVWQGGGGVEAGGVHAQGHPRGASDGVGVWGGGVTRGAQPHDADVAVRADGGGEVAHQRGAAATGALHAWQAGGVRRRAGGRGGVKRPGPSLALMLTPVPRMARPHRSPGLHTASST